MAIPINVPRLGWTMDEGVFAGWLKNDGDQVRAGEMLFCLESEKSTEEIECLDAGILRIAPDAPKMGDTVKVGALLGHLVQEGEMAPVASGPTAPIPGPREQAKAPVAPRKPAAAESSRSRPTISPRARRTAQARGVEWTTLRGGGRSGRIRERDILAAATSPKETVAVGSLRKIIAQRMLESHRCTAPVTLHSTADATALVALRNQFKSAAEQAPSYTDFFVKLAAAALGKHPLLNARWNEDKIVPSAAIHIGIAVDTEAGLVAPVIRDVQTLNLREVAACVRDLVERAHGRRLRVEEMRGGTFTITNLGGFGIDAFTPIINYPECAVLGVGRIQRQPVVIGEEIVIRDRITLSLTFDHRIVDGAPAARFLQTLCGMIEAPQPWLAV